MRGQPSYLRTLCAIIAASILLVPGTGFAQRASAGHPNIVFVLTDDLSWNLVQYMPHVVRMQKDGVTFANYFVTDSLCCPSRSSIFTGRYPHNTGIFRNVGEDGGHAAFRSRGLERTTFAVTLSGAGHRTAMLGKYLNGYLPAKDGVPAGWSEWGVAGNGYPGFNYGLNQNGRLLRYGASASDYMTDVLSGLAVRFIKEAGDRPFLIEIATFAPHAPYTPAPRDAQAFAGLSAPRTAAFDAAPDASTPPWLSRMPALTDRDRAALDAAFRKRAQSVLAVDKMIGELEAAVAAIGKEKSTYFVFSSDNGLHMGEHRMMPGKMTAYDIDVHVPLIVAGPDLPAGRVVDALAENVDLNPTFLELAGATNQSAVGQSAVGQSAVDGRSLVPLLRGEKPTDWRSAILVEHHGPLKDPSDPDAPAARSGNPPSYEAMRTAQALYVEYADGFREYHDLAADPAELRNSYRTLPDRDKVRLHETLAAMQSCQGSKACTAAARAVVMSARQ